ncbi:hypothetical protein ACFS7Z_04855 [Pontibacter toksunensis]|uniref:Uncharacterized protein n=1 Tax=Pontibacter toksunensis TaxID=1332631 RepID=A0ABW6BRT6_9BACT
MQLTTDLLACEIATDSSLLRSRWLGELTSRTYRKNLLHACVLLKVHNLSYWLYRTSKHYTPDVSDQTWMQDVLFPLLRQTNLQRCAVVVSEDIFQQLVADTLCSRSNRVFKGKIK